MDFNPEEAMAALDPAHAQPGSSPVFPKYQWSIFAGEGKNEQYVVRENSLEQFKIAVKAVKSNLQLRSQVSAPPQQESNLTAKCAIHGVEMKHYSNEKGEWWSHKTQDGGWCNGVKVKYPNN